MVAKEILQTREPGCNSVDALLVLAAEALTEPEDIVYAKGLLEKAEQRCRRPADYARVAEMALSTGDAGYASALYQRAEDTCRRAREFAELAHSHAARSGDRDKARVLLQRAADSAGAVSDCLMVAGCARDDLGDETLVKELLGKAQAKSVDDYVRLAEGYQRLFDDREKVERLLEQAQELTRTGEDHVQLAEGLWRLLQDASGSTAAYEQAISHMDTVEALMDLAETVVRELGDKTLALKAYAKVETKLNTAVEYVRLAQDICEILEDREAVTELYGRTEDKFAGNNDLMTLAGGVNRHLGDRPRAAKLYTKALDKTEGFRGLMKLAGSLHENLNDPALYPQTLDKAEQSATTTDESLDVARLAISLLDDRDLAARALDAAEERVSELGEMRRLRDAVNTCLPEDGRRIARVQARLGKREENQAQYIEFQRREDKVKSFPQLLKLVDAVMEELQDAYYARKLLAGAETRLKGEPFDLNKHRELILAVDRHLADQDWLQRLLDDCERQARQFTQVRILGRLAARELSDTTLGQNMARRIYEDVEKGLDSAASVSVYDYTKLAAAVWEDLEDAPWTRRLLGRADRAHPDFLALSHIGRILQSLGDREAATRHYLQAAEACSNASQYVQLVNRLRAYGMGAQELRAVYAKGNDTLKNPWDRLRWAEGIYDMLKDKAWAAQVYEELEPEFTSESQRAVFQTSRRTRLGKQFYGGDAG